MSDFDRLITVIAIVILGVIAWTESDESQLLKEQLIQCQNNKDQAND